MSHSPERFITVFNQEGRLWQVEYALKAVKLSDITAVAAKGTDSVVVAVQKKIPHILIDPSSLTHMFRISEHVGACLVGLLTDVLYICRRLRYEAANFQRKNGFEIPVSVLAAHLSSLHQLESQYLSIRPTAVSAILFGFDPVTASFALYRVDPAGLASGFRAVSAGGKENEAMAALEKRTDPLETVQETKEFVLGTLRSVAGVDLAPKDVEVAVMTRDSSSYRLLSAAEVQELLPTVAGKS
jgi:20S proteasome subunit alpha 1